MFFKLLISLAALLQPAPVDSINVTDGLVWPQDYSNCVNSTQKESPLPKNVPNATWSNTGSPPKRFQGDVRVTVSFQDPEKINKIAAGKPVCGVAIFAYTLAETKTLHLPNPCKYPQTDAYARLVCHEMGHANGWPGFHGD